MKDLAVLGFLMFFVSTPAILIYPLKEQKITSAIVCGLGLTLYIIGMVFQ